MTGTTLRHFAALDRKLLRDLWHIKGQALAIALVIACGVGMYVMSNGMLQSLEETRRAYYERYRFADVIAPVKRAPESIINSIAALPGVRRAEGRIRVGAVLDVAGASAPVTGVLISLPETRRLPINALVLRQGRYPDPAKPEEVLVLEGFAQAHGLALGDSLSAILHGTRRALTMVGTVLSPEFVYAIAPGELVPDDRRYGVLWMQRRALASAFDLDGAFNEALLLLGQDAQQRGLIARLDRLLEAYGTPGAYGRDRQLSDQFLSNEIEQLRVMGRLLPPIFLLVATFLLNVVIGRLIDTEREQIGLLKAFGYSDRAVGWHYLKMMGGIALLGVALGCLLGVWLGRGLASMYMEYFKFPFLIFRAQPDVFLIAVAFSLLVAVLGTLSAVLRVMRLQPAVAMVPPAPPDYRRAVGGIQALSGWLDQPSRMILRHLLRWPRRAAMTSIGIAMSMGLLIGSSFTLDAMLHMVDISFNVIDRQDVTVSFTEARSLSALSDLRHEPGVMKAEPFRAVPVVLRNGHLRRRESVIGLLPNSGLSRLVDNHYRAVTLPQEGLVLSAKLAESLRVQAGDRLLLEVREGRRAQRSVRVAKVVKTYLGTVAYMDLDALSRILQEAPALNGAYLLVDAQQTQALYNRLKHTPVVAGVGLQEAAQRAFYDTLRESLGTFVFFNTLFAGLIAIGVVYNSARISLSERGRELASLRVLGLTRAEVSYILLGELAVLTLLALPLGALMGKALAWLLVTTFDTELFRIPLVIADATYGYAALVVLVAAVASGLMVRRRIDRLDLISVLKTRE